jgi:hypothetical protein
MTTEINLRIVLQNPFEGIRYGLQKGKGPDYETVQGQLGALWNGRIKVPLPEAAFENIQPDVEQFLWSCNIPGRNKDGKPVFATVKPFEGWFRQK